MQASPVSRSNVFLSSLLKVVSSRQPSCLVLAAAAIANLGIAGASWGQAAPVSASVSWDEAPQAAGLRPAAVVQFGDAIPRVAQVPSPPISPGSPPADSAPPSDRPADIDRPPPEEFPESAPQPGTAPRGAGETISDIQIRYLNRQGQPTEGQTRPYVFTREFDLHPGDVYNQQLAQQGLDRVASLGIVRRATLTLEPTADPTRAVLVVNVQERNALTASLGTISPATSALQGPFQQRPALRVDENEGLQIDGNVRLLSVGGSDQTIALQLRGGEHVLDGAILFIDPRIGNSRTGYALNVFNQRAIPNVFSDGDRDVDLPNDNTPWVHRLGGGFQFFRPIASDLTVAAGANYQRISIRDDFFGDRVFPRDERGNRLTVSNEGQDDLLTVNLAATLDRRNDIAIPTSGYQVRVGVDQAIPIGDASITFTRLSANYTQYVPLSLFGFAPGPRTLAFNVQGGTILGDVPPYDAFDLDTSPVHRYGGNGIGTGSSFALAAAEYRFPIANLNLFAQPVNLGGSVFVGYASDLGTADDVIGAPASARDKPGDGLGYGLALRAITPIGLLRLELGFSDDGTSIVFRTGDRF